jgi:hypothetical protein
MLRPRTTFFLISAVLLSVLAAGDPNNSGVSPSSVPQSNLSKLWNWLKLPKRKIDSGANADGSNGNNPDTNSNNQNTDLNPIPSTDYNVNGDKKPAQTNFYDDNANKGKLNNPDGGQIGAPTVPPLAPPPGTNGQSGTGPGPNQVKIPHFWIPICWIIDPLVPADRVNSVVKAVTDSFGQCDIAVEPYVFRVPSIENNYSSIISKAKTACPLNGIFGSAGSAVQVMVPWDNTADRMCGKNDPKDKDVAGCAELGNGAHSGGKFTPSTAGNYGAMGQKGVPAVNILDKEGWGDGVACHELGHNVGGPGEGGNYLLNTGDHDNIVNGHGGPDAGQGLEQKITAIWLYEFFAGPEGEGLGAGCSFTPGAGCSSLRGGTTKNDGTHVWDPTRDYYYYDRPDDPPEYVFDGRNFFDPPIAKPTPPPRLASPPQRQQLVMDDFFNTKTSVDPSGKKAPGDDGGVRHPKKIDPVDALLNALAKKNGYVPPVIGDPTFDSSGVRPDASGKASGSSFVFDENAGKSEPQSSSSAAGAETDTTLNPGNGSGGGAGGFAFDEGAAKGGGGASGSNGVASPKNASAGTGASGGSTDGSGSATGSAGLVGSGGAATGADPLAAEKK